MHLPAKLIAVAAATAVLLSAAAPASGSTVVGRTQPPVNGCGAGFTRLQTATSLYAVPSSGVLTSWSFAAAPTNPPGLQLKLGRPNGGTNFTIVGESAVETMAANALNTFPIRISVHAGDVLGSYQSADGQCSANSPGFALVFLMSNQPVGSTATFSGPTANTEIPLAATLEADADHDDFGDETQDKCLGTPGNSSGCPSTLALDSAKQKGTKPKVKVTATVPGAGTLQAGSANDASLASASGSRSLKAVSQTVSSTSTQQVTVTLKLTKSAKKKLADKGKLKIKVKVVYTPPGGPAGSQTAKVKLKT